MEIRKEFRKKSKERKIQEVLYRVKGAIQNWSQFMKMSILKRLPLRWKLLLKLANQHLGSSKTILLHYDLMISSTHSLEIILMRLYHVVYHQDQWQKKISNQKNVFLGWNNH